MSNDNSAREAYIDYKKKQKTEGVNEFSPFKPRLADSFDRRFKNIVMKILEQLPSNRVLLLEKILNESVELVKNHEDPEEGLKFVTVISILKDLLSQGWRIKQEKNSLVELAPPRIEDSESKVYLRKQLQVERNAQLKTGSIQQFIKRMEKIKVYNDNKISIKTLIGDNELLHDKLKSLLDVVDSNIKSEMSKKIVSPYIQLVTNERCQYTGYKLRDVWRYFRHTWSIPYKSTPGRKMYYLIRDSAQPFHPVVGIFALGNSVLHLTKRDNYIGWTLDSIKQLFKQKVKVEKYEEMLKGDLGLKRKVEKEILLETDKEYEERIDKESVKLLGNIEKFLDEAIIDIKFDDLVTNDEINNPSMGTIDRLENLVAELRVKQFNNKRTYGEIDWNAESKSPLFKKKRAQELSKLLSAKLAIKKIESEAKDTTEIVQKLLTYRSGKILNIALQANRKKKIGTNMMEIIVCGSIPPYNELLAGKLVSIMAISPTVIKQYKQRYSKQISEIASRMKGSEIVRDSQLAFLGTTSLYQMGSSQYNRIKVPSKNGYLEYKRLGETEGYGSVFFTNKTSELMTKMLETIEGGRRINNVFGEGTSPRMRLMRMGLANLGIPDKFVKHYTKRIVYGIELAFNSREFLKGEVEYLDYHYPLDGNEEEYTQELIDFWRNRWFLKRIENVDILYRLRKFNPESIVVSNFI